MDELTDNDVKDILVERVANTEKSVGKAIKVLKGVLIAIICFIIISIFSVSLLAIENDIEKKQQKNEKVILLINLLIDNATIIIRIATINKTIKIIF